MEKTREAAKIATPMAVLISCIWPPLLLCGAGAALLALHIAASRFADCPAMFSTLGLCVVVGLASGIADSTRISGNIRSGGWSFFPRRVIST